MLQVACVDLRNFLQQLLSDASSNWKRHRFMRFMNLSYTYVVSRLLDANEAS